MRNAHFHWRGMIGAVSIGRLFIRGYVLPATHPSLFREKVNLGLHFEIGTLKGQHGHPLMMLGNVDSGIYTKKIVVAHNADWYFPAAEVKEGDDELSLTTEFVDYITRVCCLPKDRQEMYDNLRDMHTEAASMGMSAVDDPEFRKMEKWFWDHEKSKARSLQEVEDCERASKILAFS